MKTDTDTPHFLIAFAALRYLTESSFFSSLAQQHIHNTTNFQCALEDIKQAKIRLEKAEEQCKKFILLKTTSIKEQQ